MTNLPTSSSIHGISEHYPTSPNMIKAIVSDLVENTKDGAASLLHIASGDGTILKGFEYFRSQMQPSSQSSREAFDFGKLYAIERNVDCVSNLDSSVQFAGSNFHETNLINISVNIIFCNPPHKEYEDWTSKIISMASSDVIYMVLPQGWSDNKLIALALKQKGCEADIIHSEHSQCSNVLAFDVDVVRFVTAANKKAAKRFYNDRLFTLTKSLRESGFNEWFQENFNNLASLKVQCSIEKRHLLKQHLTDVFAKSNNIADMVYFFKEDMNLLLDNYKSLNEVDQNALHELGVEPKSIIKTFSNKSQLLKDSYWSKFFDSYKPITKRLTKRYRDDFKDLFIRKSAILDFNEENMIIITQLLLKDANYYNEEQVKDFFFRLSNAKSVKNYKSNEKVFSGNGNGWRYHKDDSTKAFELDYRIIMKGVFSVQERYESKYLSMDKYTSLVDDLIIIARLVGMPLSPDLSGASYMVGKEIPNHGEKFVVEYRDSITQKIETLFTLKVYINGNQHLTMNKQFSLRFNIMVAKLLGWLKSPDEVEAEMNVTDKEQEQIKTFFNDLSTAIPIGDKSIRKITA